MRLDDLIETDIRRALDSLMGEDVARTITRMRAEHILRQLAQYVAANAKSVTRLGLLTTGQVAELLGVKYSTVCAWCRKGLLPGAEMVGVPPKRHIWLIPEGAVEGFTPPRRYGRGPRLPS